MDSDEQQKASTSTDQQASGGTIKTPEGTLAVVFVYALLTIVLWFYFYYEMLRFEGYLGGH